MRKLIFLCKKERSLSFDVEALGLNNRKKSIGGGLLLK